MGVLHLQQRAFAFVSVLRICNNPARFSQLNLAIRYFSYVLLEELPKYAASWRFNDPFGFNVTSRTVHPFSTAHTFCASRDGPRNPEIS